MGDFQGSRSDRARTAHGSDPIVEPLDPQISINVSVQRITMGWRNRTGRSPMTSWMPQGEVPPHPRVPPNLRSHSSAAIAAPSSGVPDLPSSTSSIAWRTSREFRRFVYWRNLWVQPPLDQDRIRESSPEFYRSNLAQTQRLVPWLSRESFVLLDASVTYYQACSEILNWITIYPINSCDFERMAHPYFGSRTKHFVHEFYNFAISPYDLPEYDLRARYTPSSQVQSSAERSLPDILNVCPPTINLSLGWRHHDMLRGSMDSVQPEIIVLSSDDSDSEIEIIEGLPPREVLSLEDSEHDSDVIEVKPPTPPLIVVSDSSDSDSFSTSHPSTPNRISDPSTHFLLHGERKVINFEDSEHDSDVIEVKPPTPPLIVVSDSSDSDSFSTSHPSTPNRISDPSTDHGERKGINFEDSEHDSDVIEVKPPTPPLIEVSDSSDSDSFSTPHPSSSHRISDPSSSSSFKPTDAPLKYERTARFPRPSYKECSSTSSSEDALPPMKLRRKDKANAERKVINFEDSEHDSDVIEVKPPTPPLIEVSNSSDSDSFSAPHPSIPNRILGPSLPTGAPLKYERTARFPRPSYKECSSSSENDLPPKKMKGKKRRMRLKKRIL